jgi:hypothetical protein
MNDKWVVYNIDDKTGRFDENRIVDNNKYDNFPLF